MKKPKVGDSVIINKNKFKVLSLGEYGFFVESNKSSTGRYYIFFGDDYTIIEQEKSKIPWSFFVVFAIALLIIIFNTFVR